MKTLVSISLLALTQFGWANSNLNIETVQVLADRHHCESFQFLVEHIPEHQALADSLEATAKQARNDGDLTRASVYSTAAVKVQWVVEEQKFKLEKLNKSLFATFSAHTSQDHFIARSDLNQKHGSWELHTLRWADQDHLALNAGSFYGRILGSVACKDFDRNEVNANQLAVERALKSLLNE